MNSEERKSIKIKAESIRLRNNNLERLVSALHGPRRDGDSILIRDVSPQTHREMWEEAMQLLATQFNQIQELIGMVSD